MEIRIKTIIQQFISILFLAFLSISCGSNNNPPDDYVGTYFDWSDEGGHPNPGEVQWEWLENDLKEAQENPEIKFTECIYHTPAYSLGGHTDNLVMQNVTNELF